MFELRPVEGYEGRYSVTADGRVWSHIRDAWLRPGGNKTGYLSVILHDGSKRKTMSVHRLVALAWVPNADPVRFIEINHINGCKSANRSDNLEWCSRSTNLKHAYATGLRPRKRPHGLLSDAQAAEVRALVSAGLRQVDVARRFSVGKHVVNSIVRNRSYVLQHQEKASV